MMVRKWMNGREFGYKVMSPFGSIYRPASPLAIQTVRYKPGEITARPVDKGAGPLAVFKTLAAALAFKKATRHYTEVWEVEYEPSFSGSLSKSRPIRGDMELTCELPLENCPEGTAFADMVLLVRPAGLERTRCWDFGKIG